MFVTCYLRFSSMHLPPTQDPFPKLADLALKISVEDRIYHLIALQSQDNLSAPCPPQQDLFPKLADPALNISMENHMFGLPPDHYTRWPVLEDNWNILTTTRDRWGRVGGCGGGVGGGGVRWGWGWWGALAGFGAWIRHGKACRLWCASGRRMGTLGLGEVSFWTDGCRGPRCGGVSWGLHGTCTNEAHASCRLPEQRNLVSTAHCGCELHLHADVAAHTLHYRNGTEYVSTAEHKSYPFFATQVGVVWQERGQELGLACVFGGTAFVFLRHTVCRLAGQGAAAG